MLRIATVPPHRGEDATGEVVDSGIGITWCLRYPLRMRVLRRRAQVILAKKGKSQADACKGTGISPQLFSSWLNQKNARLDTLIKISHVVGMTLYELLAPLSDEEEENI